MWNAYKCVSVDDVRLSEGHKGAQLNYCTNVDSGVKYFKRWNIYPSKEIEWPLESYYKLLVYINNRRSFLLILLSFSSLKPYLHPTSPYFISLLSLSFFSLSPTFFFPYLVPSFPPRNKLSKKVNFLSSICGFPYLAIRINQLCVSDNPAMMGK